MPGGKVTGAGGINVGIAPFAFQFYARDFYAAYKTHHPSGPFSPARLFLLARSIELAAKALQLVAGQSAKQLRDMNHDLVKACNPSTLSSHGISLTPEEEVHLRKANEYYSHKGFEYFFFKLRGVPEDRSGPQSALCGWPNRPDENLLEGILAKLLAVKL